MSQATHTHSSRSQTLPLSNEAYDQANLCVHCGLCLPACPTYTENQLEAESPRGRIHLMKAMADGRIEASATVIDHLDHCLDCRACETACPSGVVYHKVIEEARELYVDKQQKNFVTKLIEREVLKTFPYRDKMRRKLFPIKLLKAVKLWNPVRGMLSKILPRGVWKMIAMLPDELPKDKPLWGVHPAKGQQRMRVGLFTGCVGSVMYGHVHENIIDLLTHFGCEVVVPESQVCCGAIHQHAGHSETGQAFAKTNVKVFEEVDVVVNGIAGCGAQLKSYTGFGDTWKSMDISELLLELNLPEPTHEINQTVTYHDACHLIHGQGVKDPPRILLSKIKGLNMVTLAESDMCCGAAGTYHLTQPEMGSNLGLRKLKAIKQTGANITLMGNIGCAMHLEAEARTNGINVQIKHPVELLHEAYLGR